MFHPRHLKQVSVDSTALEIFIKPLQIVVNYTILTDGTLAALAGWKKQFSAPTQ